MTKTEDIVSREVSDNITCRVRVVSPRAFAPRAKGLGVPWEGYPQGIRDFVGAKNPGKMPRGCTFFWVFNNSPSRDKRKSGFFAIFGDFSPFHEQKTTKCSNPLYSGVDFAESTPLPSNTKTYAFPCDPSETDKNP